MKKAETKPARQITFRAEEELMAQIEARANEHGVSINTWLKRVAKAGLIGKLGTEITYTQTWSI